MKKALIFPGQGTQTIGMGKELYENFTVAKDVFNEVDEALGFKLTNLMFEGDIAELTQTENAQPAIMAMSLAIVKVLESETKKSINQLCDVVAGHSLGEYSALCAARALSITDTAKLLRTRGLAMKEAADKNPGGMAAILGLTIEDLKEITSNASSKNAFCSVANDNCPGQVVISGHFEALDKAIELALAKGAKKAVKLPISGAFHSPLIEQAAQKMQEVLAQTNIENPIIPIIPNVTACTQQDAQTIKELLIKQVTGSVRWTESVNFMTQNGVNTFVECGNGKVLTGLVKRIATEATTINLNTKQSILDNLETL